MSEQGKNMVRLSKANDFMIWREAESVKWECTTKDLAQATGLTVRTVREHIRQNGWRDRLPRYRNPARERRAPVDRLMR